VTIPEDGFAFEGVFTVLLKRVRSGWIMVAGHTSTGGSQGD